MVFQRSLRMLKGIVFALLFCTPALSQSAGDIGSRNSSPGREPITPIPLAPAADPLKLALGQRLFESVRLSKDGTKSCSSCHDTGTNGANTHQRDKLSGSSLSFNTPTIFNAVLSFRLNWEGNYRTLESHADFALAAAGVMGAGVDTVIERLNADPVIAQQFIKAYGHRPDRSSLLNAIATYERSLLTPGSSFDRWLAGEKTALTSQEMTGYKLFKSLGCVSCHQGVNVGGNLFQRHGIFHPLASPKPEILRVPSLRNVATTPPYFHDGSAPTLGDAVRKMGLAQLNADLSDDQVAALVAFLRTLTGTYRDKPVTRAAP